MHIDYACDVYVRAHGRVPSQRVHASAPPSATTRPVTSGNLCRSSSGGMGIVTVWEGSSMLRPLIPSSDLPSLQFWYCARRMVQLQPWWTLQPSCSNSQPEGSFPNCMPTCRLCSECLCWAQPIVAPDYHQAVAQVALVAWILCRRRVHTHSLVDWLSSTEFWRFSTLSS
jgi:hypothetical protein